YKEYYAFATGEAVPKPKASARRKRSDSDTSITPPTATTTPTTIVAVTPRLTAAAKGKQPAKAKSQSDPSEVARTEAQQLKIVLKRSRHQTHISQLGGSCTDEGTGSKPRVSDIPTDESEKELSWNSSDDEGADDQECESDEEDDNEETRDEESFDPILRTSESSKDEGDGEEDQGLRINEEERLNEEEGVKELYRDVNINQGRGIQATLDVKDSHVTLTSVHPNGQQESLSVSSHFVTSMLNPPSDAGMDGNRKPETPSEVLQNLSTFDSVFRFEDRLKSLEANFSEYIQTNPFAKAVSNIPGIVHQYMNQQMTEAVRVAVQIQINRLHDSYQRENDEFFRTINENIKRIIKESSHSSRTSYAVAVDLSEMELKKILI
nr:hypothetical protein [Tanacetum cinerariifolium]